MCLICLFIFFCAQILLVAVLAMTLVLAVPVDEGIFGEGASDAHNPQEPQEFLKLLKLKKLLFLG